MLCGITILFVRGLLLNRCSRECRLFDYILNLIREVTFCRFRTGTE